MPATQDNGSSQKPHDGLQTNGRTFGVEINPFGAYHYLSDDKRDDIGDRRTLSFGISYFSAEYGTEIVMPFYYDFEVGSHGFDETVHVVDLRCRLFADGKIDGAYLGLFGRYTRLEGKLNNENRTEELEKYGLGLEVGIRLMDIFDTPLYWGASLGFGRYFGEKNNRFDDTSLALEVNDHQKFIDVEFFKFGYRF